MQMDMRSEKVQFLLSKADRSGECWNWMGGKHGVGYGCVPASVHKSHYAHRAMYDLVVAPIEKDQYVLHSCDNRSCVNPAHLRAGSHLENIRDMHMRNRQKGGSMPGEKNPSCKFPDSLINEIRNARKNGVKPIEIQRRYGISETHYYRVVKGDIRNG
jgi:hypothetical protein